MNAQELERLKAFADECVNRASQPESFTVKDVSEAVAMLEVRNEQPPGAYFRTYYMPSSDILPEDLVMTRYGEALRVDVHAPTKLKGEIRGEHADHVVVDDPLKQQVKKGG